MDTMPPNLKSQKTCGSCRYWDGGFDVYRARCNLYPGTWQFEKNPEGLTEETSVCDSWEINKM